MVNYGPTGRHGQAFPNSCPAHLGTFADASVLAQPLLAAPLQGGARLAREGDQEGGSSGMGSAPHQPSNV